MAVDQDVNHILTVSGHSENSFDEATRNAIEGGWENHREEFESFVSYEVVRLSGPIEMEGNRPVVFYTSTVAISAIHRRHGGRH